VLVVALGIAESGEKHVLGVWQGATENTTVVKGLLEDLVERGLDLQRRYLVVMDGSKALRAGVERVFGAQVEVQRCQIHKRRNVKEYLPENCQKDYDRRMRNAYAMNNRLWNHDKSYDAYVAGGLQFTPDLFARTDCRLFS
jgi:transposase-like protein